eukprot:scaffold92704_cov59-Phaeocystis_antarctica.AAC.4
MSTVIPPTFSKQLTPWTGNHAEAVGDPTARAPPDRAPTPSERQLGSPQKLHRNEVHTPSDHPRPRPTTHRPV